MKKLVAFALMCMTGAGGAFGLKWSMLASPSSLTGEYDFFSESPIPLSIGVAISEMNADKLFPYYISADPAPGSRSLVKAGTDYTLPYRLYSRPSTPRYEIYDNSSASSPSQVITGEFSEAVSGSESDSRSHDLYLVATPGISVPAGMYSGSFTVRLTKRAFHSPSDFSSQDIPVMVTVPVYAELSVVPSGNLFDPLAKSAVMDFGEMMEGSARSLDVLAKSNANYSLAITSSRGGKIAKTSDPAQFVPYTLTLAGRRLVLQPGVATTAISNAPWTAGGLARYSLKVVIGPHGSLDQGVYSDNLTLTISGN